MRRRSPQLAFSLRPPRRWGGSRPGAGRKRSASSGVRHASRERLRTTLPAHVTLRMLPGVPSLRLVPVVKAIEASFAKACERESFRLVHYSLQSNHAHLIVEARDRDARVAA